MSASLGRREIWLVGEQTTFGELSLEGDHLQVVALDVVEVGREPQPLGRDGEVGGGPAGLVEAEHDAQDPDCAERHGGDHHERADHHEGRAVVDRGADHGCRVGLRGEGTSHGEHREGAQDRGEAPPAGHDAAEHPARGDEQETPSPPAEVWQQGDAPGRGRHHQEQDDPQVPLRDASGRPQQRRDRGESEHHRDDRQDHEEDLPRAVCPSARPEDQLEEGGGDHEDPEGHGRRRAHPPQVGRASRAARQAVCHVLSVPRGR